MVVLIAYAKLGLVALMQSISITNLCYKICVVRVDDFASSKDRGN